MATRYRNLQGPVAVDTNSIDNGDAQTAQALAGAFKEFSNQGFEIAGGLATERGRQAGSAAGATSDPAFRAGMRAQTMYGQAYNNAALRSYAVHAEADADDTAVRLEAEANNDPEKFKATLGAVHAEVLKQAPEQARGVLDEIYTRKLGDGTARLTQSAMAEQKAKARVDVSEGISRSTDRIAQYRATDDPAQHVLADEEDHKLAMLIDASVKDGTLTQVEGVAAHVNAQRSVTAQTVSAKFSRVLDDPYADPVKFIENLKKVNRSSDLLPPDQEDKLVASLLSDLREKNMLDSARSQEAEHAEKARYEAGDRVATAAMIDGSLSPSQLLHMVQQQRLEPSVARTLHNELQNPTAADDPEVAFNVRANLLDYTDDDIKTQVGLTWKTKGDLLLKKREDEQSWKNTQAAREADDRIDRALGIVPGTMIQTLPVEVRTARDTAKTKFYKEVDALPANERQNKVLSVADDVVKKVIRSNTWKAADRALEKKKNYMKLAGDPKDMSPEKRAQFEKDIARYDATISKANTESMQ